MRTIEFMVEEQHIWCRKTISDLVGNTREYVKAEFIWSGSWVTNIIKIAVFTANGKSYPVVIESHGAYGECEVPYKVMMQESFTVGLYGGAGTERITTDTCTIRVEESVRYQGGSDYVDMYQKMKNEVDIMCTQIGEYKAAVQETMTDHIEHKIHTPDGAHDIRIHNGMFQYYDGGWHDAQVAAEEVQGYSWLTLSMLRFTDQYKVKGQFSSSHFILQEKGDKVSGHSIGEFYMGGMTEIIYAKAGKLVYEWKVCRDSSSPDGLKVESISQPQGDAKATVTLGSSGGTVLVMFENTSEDGDSVEFAIFDYVDKSHQYEEWLPKFWIGPRNLVDPVDYVAEENIYVRIGDIIFVQGKFTFDNTTIGLLQEVDMGFFANGVYRLQILDINKNSFAKLWTSRGSKYAGVNEIESTTTEFKTMYIYGYFCVQE